MTTPRVLVCCSALLLLRHGVARPAGRRPALLAGRLDGHDAGRGRLPDRARGDASRTSRAPSRWTSTRTDACSSSRCPAIRSTRSPTGRIKLLEDTDGDGRYETSRVFADGLVLPTGVMRWKKGVLVTAPPDLLYLEDTNGDGRADVRTVVHHRLRVHQPAAHGERARLRPRQLDLPGARGPGAGGDLQGRVRRSRDAACAGRAIRSGRRSTSAAAACGCGRMRGRLEATSGSSQYGHGFDAWGRYFTTENADHARHEVMPAAWLARNPRPAARLGDGARSPDHGATAQVFPITKRPTFELLTGAGEFTSACAITPYTGGAFPDGATARRSSSPSPCTTSCTATC